ncbi:MAG: fumarylacetoacetate hydrolase family protein [Bacteroidetes bacterium]|nr:fumarylacetoacetate hydrolase family protein [Bacteroidota bacterium]
MIYSIDQYPAHTTIVGELNGLEAYEAAQRRISPYPPFLRVPETVVGEEVIPIYPEFRNIIFYAEIFFVLGRDVEYGEGKGVMDAILGFGICLGMRERSLIEEAEYKRASPRDLTSCGWYQLFMDKTHIIGRKLVEDQFIDDISDCRLTLSIPGYEIKEFNMSNILWKPLRLLEEMSFLVPLKRYDRIFLGPVDAPIKIYGEAPLSNNSNIVINSNNYFEKLTVKVQMQ